MASVRPLPIPANDGELPSTVTRATSDLQPLGDALAELATWPYPAENAPTCPDCGEPSRGGKLCNACLEMRATDRDRADVNEGATMASIDENYRVTTEQLAARGVAPSLIAEAGKLIREPRVVLYGERSGAGKSSLMGWMLAQWATSRTRPREPGGRVLRWSSSGVGVWLSAHALADEMNMDPAWLSAKVLVLDDVGNERQMKSSLIPALVDARYAKGKALWVTTALTRDGLAKKYSDATARRIYERAPLLVVP